MPPVKARFGVAQRFERCDKASFHLGLQRVHENRISGRTVEQTPPKSSREAAACDSPARKCRVGWGRQNESRRDGTSSHALSLAPAGPRRAAVGCEGALQPHIVCNYALQTLDHFLRRDGAQNSFDGGLCIE